MGEFFIKRPVFAISMAIAMTLMGVVALSDLSVQQFPDITPPVVQVSASYVGADAQTVNNSVAVPLAQEVMGVGDMLYMQTTSANDGTMSMQVTFDIGSSPDMDAIFTQNNVAAATAKLPQAVTEQGVVTRKSDTGFLMVYALASDGRYDDEFLSNYAYINLEDELAKINGVGKVSIMGAGEYAMRIWIKPDRLHYYGLSLDEVLSAIRTQSGVYPAGKFGAEPAPEDAIYTYTVTLPAQISTAEEFSQIIISLDNNGNEIRLENVADVALGSQTYGIRSMLGDNPSTLIVVYQEPGSNAVEVGGRVKGVVEKLQQRLPDGVNIYTVVDGTKNVNDGVKDIIRTLIIALLLVIVIIYLFLQDWRATIIPLVAIPVSLMGAFMLFPLLDFSLNVISLLGMVLAIGLVVDDAIVVVEAVQRNIERGMNRVDATIDAMRRVSSPIIATTVVLLAVFIPVSFVSGITGLLFRQFSITIATAIVFSAFNALTLSPALCAILLRPHEKSKRGLFAAFNRWFDRRMESYGTFSNTIVKHTARTAIFVAVTFLLTVIGWEALPSGFLPEEDQGYLMVIVGTPDASSLQTTMHAMNHVEQVVASRPEVEFTSLAAGFNMIAGISSTNSGIIFVVLKDYSQRKLSAAQIASQLTEELYVLVPEAECYAFIPPSIPGLGVTSGITLEVQDLEGRGTAYLMEQTQHLMDSLRHSPMVATVSTQFNADIPRRRLDIDKRQALSQGVALADVYSSISAYLGGSYIGNFNKFGKLYQSYIQASPDRRLNGRSLDYYYVENSSGESVPLSAFVTVKDTVGVEYITLFNLNESISLTVTPSAKASTGDAMKDIESIADKVLPDDVGFSWSGMSYQEANASKSGTAVYMLALLFVFLALAALYNSWGLPLAILMSVPVAVVGALVAVIAAHAVNALYVNNIYMQISLVMLIGLAAKNAILVVEYADNIFLGSKSISLLDAAIDAARQRVRPIIMTAFAFILGVMPLVFASGIYSTARNIMGVALVGGMLLATLVGIFLYPATYYLVAKIGHFERRRETKM
ncbi:MAG: efflux RND transporter permease subunit [Alistipes sp.]|nr:efflux RND transporter permease subunit [Alistipes sp.]